MDLGELSHVGLCLGCGRSIGSPLGTTGARVDHAAGCPKVPRPAPAPTLVFAQMRLLAEMQDPDPRPAVAAAVRWLSYWRPW